MGERMAMTPEHMLKQCGEKSQGPGDAEAKKRAGMTPPAPKWNQDKAERVVHEGKE